MKIVFYDGPEGKLEYEEGGGILLLHATSYCWRLSIYKKYLNVLKTFLVFAQSKGYTEVYSAPPKKNGKFSRIMGGTYVRGFTNNNEECEVYKWELNGML